jgi:hypothetical protein
LRERVAARSRSLEGRSGPELLGGHGKLRTSPDLRIVNHCVGKPCLP